MNQRCSQDFISEKTKKLEGSTNRGDYIQKICTQSVISLFYKNKIYKNNETEISKNIRTN